MTRMLGFAAAPACASAGAGRTATGGGPAASTVCETGSEPEVHIHPTAAAAATPPIRERGDLNCIATSPCLRPPGNAGEPRETRRTAGGALQDGDPGRATEKRRKGAGIRAGTKAPRDLSWQASHRLVAGALAGGLCAGDHIQ